MNKKLHFYYGYTMAELLITLTVIGIIAALTFPTLIENYKKTEVETKLKRFYSICNQAVMLSEIENGDKKLWNIPECQADEFSKTCLETYFDKYLKKYIKYNKTEYNNINKRYIIYLADGSAFELSYSGRDIGYFINAKNINKASNGKDAFIFAMYPNGAQGKRSKYFKNKGYEPYIESNWDGTLEGLYNSPSNFAKIIQLNGWKIPNDYPIKF